MRISIASGKGGTGKTSLIAAFSSLAENEVLLSGDCFNQFLNIATDQKRDMQLKGLE